MSEVKVNKISPRSGTTVTLGDSGDTFTLASGVSLTGVNATLGGNLDLNSNDITGTGNIDISGDASIGTSSAGILNLRGGSSTSSQIRFFDGGTARARIGVPTGQTYLSLSGSDSLTSDFLISSSEVVANESSNDQDFRVETNASTHALFVDGGNDIVFFNKSADGVNNTGLQFNGGSSNYLAVTRDGGNPLFLNRKTSDGDIAVFRKDNTTIGQIGVVGGDIPYFATSDGSQCGINLDGDAQRINPANGSGSAIDNQIDLGQSGARFKDAYLSGNIYLGGTGSANALDDYEEGTWTPVYKGDTSDPTCTYDIQSGQYIKIGRQVTAWFQLGTDASSGGSGSLRVGGIPFTPDPSGDYGGILTAEYGFATTTTIARLGNGNSNGVRVDDDEGTAATVSILGTGTNDNRLFGTIVYYTA